MKRDYKFHFCYKGKRHEYHIMADSYYEARKIFDDYVAFLKEMGCDVEDASGRTKSYSL